MKKTPLHEQHLNLGARMGEFGGWDMPIQYAGILQEHQQTRTKTAIFDICHMGEFELSGSTAQADLDRLLTCNVASLAVGQVRYGFMLNETGGVIDDLTCYRLEEDRYMLVVNAGTSEKDAAWIRSKISAGTRFEDRSEWLAKIDVQGPTSKQTLSEALDMDVPELGYFRFSSFEALGVSGLISRTGYTGEWGYEIYLPTESAVLFWEKLFLHSEIEPGGLGARDTLRLEMGYSLYGHELSEKRTPFATSRGMFVDFKKEFIGKSAVVADRDQPKELLVGLSFDSKRAARAHDRVFSAGSDVGEVTSGSVAPSLGRAVAMAFVKPHCAEIGQEVQVQIRKKMFSATVVALPFYKEGTARGVK